MLVLMFSNTDVKQEMLHEFDSTKRYGKINLYSVRTVCCLGSDASKVEPRNNKLNQYEIAQPGELRYKQ